MAQTQRRMLYAKIWTSEQFGYLSDKAKLLYVGMITLADDDGRLRGNPAYLRGQVFPYDENITIQEIKISRDEVEKSKLISVYEVDDCEYIQHPNWEDHQIIRRDLYKGSSLPNRNETVTEPLRKSTLSKDKISKDKITIAEETSAQFSLKDEIKKLEDNTRREMNIIALYFDERKPDLQTKAQYQIALKRHLRAAKQLIPFTDAQIIKGLKQAKQQTPDYTIETIVKMLTK